MKRLSSTYTRFTQAKGKAAGKVVMLVKRIARRCADYLDKKINPLAVEKKRWLLYGFCVLFAGYSIFLLLRPFLFATKNTTVKIDPIRFPKELKQQHATQDVFIPAEQYKRIHAFKLSLDSLAGSKTGRARYDSIIAMRPKLMDSLQQIEDFYQLQKLPVK